MNTKLARSLTVGTTNKILDLLFPPECAWCAQPTLTSERLCQGCRPLFLSDYYRCQKCANPLPSVVPNVDCFRCRKAKWKFSQVIALGPYRGELRKAVILMKKTRFELLRRAIGELLALKIHSTFSMECSTVSPLSPPPRLLVPVPNYWSHGFSSVADTAGLLAQGIANQTAIPVADKIVRRIRKTAKQGMLTWAERTQNVRGAFAIESAKPLIASHILLVDDVLTSGATVGELSKLMLKAGAARVSIVVAARATGTRDASDL